MLKKALIVITIILVTGVAAGWYIFTRESKYFGTSALKAVPVDVPLFVRIHNFGEFAGQTKTNVIWKEFSVFNEVSNLHKAFALTDSLINSNPDAIPLFQEKELIVVPEKKSRLFLLELGSFGEKRAIAGFFKKHFSKWQEKPVKHKSGEATVLEYLWSDEDGRKSFFITFYKGLCIAGNDFQLIGKAINQMELPSLLDDSSFKKINKTAAQYINVNLFINHSYFPKIISPLLSDSTAEFSDKTRYGLWSELDLSQKEDQLLLNGFSYSDGSFSSYLDIFMYQKPRQFTLEPYLPARCSYFITLNLDDISIFFEDYKKFLNKQGMLDSYLANLNKADSAMGTGLTKFVVDNMDAEAGVFFTENDSIGSKENRYFLMKVKSGGDAGNQLAASVKAFSSKNGIKDFVKNFRIDPETSFDIYRLPVNDFSKRVFGEVFSGVETSWFTVYDNCVIMAASYESICNYLRSVLLQETLSNSQNYRSFSSGLSQRSSLYLWVSPSRSFPFLHHIFNSELSEAVVSGGPLLKNIEAAGWQFGSENRMIYNTAKLKYNPVVTEKSPTVWKSYIGSRVVTQPQFVINPLNKTERDLVLQDTENNFYLINKEGRILWKIKLSGAILGDVKQIDYFKDGKLQFLFNTKEAIHLIDRSGNYIQNYPLALRANATNGLSVFDYDNKRDYRICLACEDHKIYIYDKKGSTVTGWSTEKTEHDVLFPVHHYRIASKDYIVFFDRENNYILDRKGKERVKSDAGFTNSKNDFAIEIKGKNNAGLVKTDSEGNVWFLGLDGTSSKVSVGKFTPRHFFVYDDITGDNLPDYIYFDNNILSVFDNSGKELFSKAFEQTIELPPYVVSVGTLNKIGIVSSSTNQVMLFNSDGSQYRDIPIEGNSPFNVGSFGKSANGLNLIVGSADGFLNNYQVK
jgi:hypothetical protein